MAVLPEIAAALALALLYRPLTLLALDDEQARRLGAPVGLLRLLVLLLAAGVTAQVVSRLGVISFAGLAGASVAHLLRVRAMGARFALSFLAGGLLLVVDSLLNIAGHFLGTLLPAGALCGVLGTPFLIFLVLRQRKSAQGFAREAPPSAPSPRLASWRTPLLVLLTLGLLAAALLCGKPLKLLALGESVAGSLGLAVRRSRSLLLVLVALMSAVATLAVGPLSFIGLMTPHLARRSGAVSPEKQLPIAALYGAALMLVADWLGRYLIFPYELGAGVIASLLGGGFFLLLLRQARPIN